MQLPVCEISLVVIISSYNTVTDGLFRAYVTYLRNNV